MSLNYRKSYTRLEFISLLNSLGFFSVRHGKHEVFSDGKKSIAVPSAKNLNRMVTQRLLKEISKHQLSEKGSK